MLMLMRFAFVVFAIVGWLGVARPVTAADKGNKQEELREQQAEQKAAQEVKAARDKWEAAKKSLAAVITSGKQAEAARDAAAKRIKEVEERVGKPQMFGPINCPPPGNAGEWTSP